MNAIEVSTYRNKMQFVVGEDSPAAVIVPEGGRAYQNVGRKDGVVINCPNRLFIGHGKKELMRYDMRTIENCRL